MANRYPPPAVNKHRCRWFVGPVLRDIDDLWALLEGELNPDNLTELTASVIHTRRMQSESTATTSAGPSTAKGAHVNARD